MTEENQPEEPQEVQASSAAADSSEPAPQAVDPSKGPRKILDALDKQAEGTVLPSGSEGPGEEPPSQESIDLSEQDTVIDSAQVFSSLHGSLDPDAMISEAMKKLDKILEDIQSSAEDQANEGFSGEAA